LSDIVERLRKQAHTERWTTEPPECREGIDVDDAEEAADEIVRLRAERYEWQVAAGQMAVDAAVSEARAEAAEAERDRLRDALRSVLPHTRYLADGVYIQRIPDDIVHQARAALGDTP
jgi:hypothetical protein